ncbi:DMT family transporter [Campylobacter hyointestinalis]|uniref:DMT family transporter n=1 Tax=Campylobacter hyointestinalis TaxID=198 RepID=UPI000DCC54CD|nr:DMT family transporter [Campylobacter hyointestinalis]RAZ51676.1 EamA/RhaT family transporter [Campylobacter hyointestinalis subsp. lawsonii]
MRKNVIAELLLVFVALSWGSTFLPVAEAIKSVNIFSFLFWRFLLATILMFILTIKLAKFDKKSMLYGSLLGFFLFCGFAFQTYALKFAYTSTVAFITGLNVVLVPFLMLIFFKERVNKFAFGGAIIAVFGLYFLSGSGGISPEIGEILAIICAFAYALHIAFTGVLTPKCNIFALVCFQFLAVSVLSFFGAVFFESGAYEFSIIGGLEANLSENFIVAVLVCALFATVFAFFIQSWAQIYTTPTKTALIFTLEPVSAGIIGYFFANEILSTLQLIGAIMILFGVLFSEIGSNLISLKDSFLKLSK